MSSEPRPDLRWGTAFVGLIPGAFIFADNIKPSRFGSHLLYLRFVYLAYLSAAIPLVIFISFVTYVAFVTDLVTFEARGILLMITLIGQGFVIVLLLRRRSRFDWSGPLALAHSYRRNFFVSLWLVGIVMALPAIVPLIAGDLLWPLLPPVGLGVLTLVLVAPSTRGVRRTEARLEREGCQYSLLNALLLPPEGEAEDGRPSAQSE